MSSLAHCLGKMGKLLSPEEVAVLRSQAADLVSDGFTADEASQKVVTDAISDLEKDLHSIILQTGYTPPPPPAAPPVPLRYGAIIEGSPSIDFRVTPQPAETTEDWVRLIRANMSEAPRGDRSGNRALTRIAAVLQRSEGDDFGAAVMAGLVVPRFTNRADGTREVNGVALQRMGAGLRERLLQPRGDKPLLLSQAIEQGWRPVAIVHFAGEPQQIFESFNSLADFDKAYSATPKTAATRGTLGVARDTQAPEVLRARKTEAELQAQIDALGTQLEKASSPEERQQLKEQIQSLYNDLVRVIERGQDQTGDQPFRVAEKGPGLATDASRAQDFQAAVGRLRSMGADVQAFGQELFAQGVTQNIQAQITAAQQAFQTATGPQRGALHRRVANLTARLADVSQAQGAAFSPWHISLAVQDVANASMGNFVTLVHEAAEAQAMRVNPVVRARLEQAILDSAYRLRAEAQEASDRTGVPLARENGPFDLLSETVAQKVAAEGLGDPSVARAILRWIRDLYYRVAMALQRAFGGQPDGEIVIQWFENQLNRVLGGDYQYSVARLLDRYLPEPMPERARLFPRRFGTPGRFADYWNPYVRAIQQPGALPQTIEALDWNIEFQTAANGLAIPDPNARAMISAAANARVLDAMQNIHAEIGSDLPWADWWRIVGVGDEPGKIIEHAEARFSEIRGVKIGDHRMTGPMNALAGYEARRMLEDIQSKAVARQAKISEQLEQQSDDTVAAAREVNRLEGDRRNAQLQEATAKARIKALVGRFIKDLNAGLQTAENEGRLAEAVRQAEGLIDGDPIPEEYQKVFRSLYDGDVPVWDYIRAIAGLELPFGEMTGAEVRRAVRDNASGSAQLAALARNRPLTTALAEFARANAGQMDEIAVGYMTDAEQYAMLHGELEEIRRASAAQLRDLQRAIDERGKASNLGERIKDQYVKRRRDLRTARERVAAAAKRLDALETARAGIAKAVEQAQIEGGTAPSEWQAVHGERFREMVLRDDNTWGSRTHRLDFAGDGTARNSEALRSAMRNNNLWLQAHADRQGSRLWQEVYRQTTELARIDLEAINPAVQWSRMAFLEAPLVANLRHIGGSEGSIAAQMMQRFQAIRFANYEEVNRIAHRWSRAWQEAQQAAGIRDVGQFQEQIYDPVNYFLNTNPGLDEDAAIRQAVAVARRRLTTEPAGDFGQKMAALLRETKTGMEFLVGVGEKEGSFVQDDRLKSGLRRAIPRGWLTSMRSMDAALVMRIIGDMQRAGWKLKVEQMTDSKGATHRQVVGAATFEDMTAEDTGEQGTDALRGMLRGLFTPGIVRDWLLPFINKGGDEVLSWGKDPIAQLDLQNAWANAGGDVLQWIDNLAEIVQPEAELTEDETGEEVAHNPIGKFRLAILRQLDGLHRMEAKMAYESDQTRNLFDPMGPKPHVIMDSRISDLVPGEHLNFARLDEHTAGMLLSHIAFHSAFGRNGQRMIQTLAAMKDRAKLMTSRYESLEGSTRGFRAAEAAARGWNYKELEGAARRLGEIERLQRALESYLAVRGLGGPFDDVRAAMEFTNFLAGQIVDQPKVGFYDVLSSFERPLGQRAFFSPRAIKTVAASLLGTGKQGLGSLLEALNLHIYHASRYETWLLQAFGGNRDLPWRTAVADIGPNRPQSYTDRFFIKPLRFLRFVQNKGVGLGRQAEFPRFAPVPGLGVNRYIGLAASVGNATAQLSELESMVREGAQYLSRHREDAENPSFRFKAADLGLKKLDSGLFDWWRAKTVEYGMGTLENIVRGALPSIARGDRLFTKDQVLKVGQIYATEFAGISSINTAPTFLVENPGLRMALPLLRWPFWKMHQVHEGLTTAKGKLEYRSLMRGLATIALWNLPAGLAFTFLLDQYDDKLLGKKSNLPNVGYVSAIPFVGPIAEAITADRSMPVTLKAYLVRMARAGNTYGLGADLIGQMASPTDAPSGRRVFSMDQRILLMSQFLNAAQAFSNMAAQDWTATWASVWNPLIRSLGGNAAFHTVDILNNVLGLDNEERRNVMRINASNWLRAAAGEVDVPLRSGGSGTPTPMSAWTREMFTAAIANDRIGFDQAYQKALMEARRAVAQDPSVERSQIDQEAERRVLSGWRGRDPLTIFAHRPTDMQLNRILGVMSEDGRQDVRDALARYRQFSDYIRPSFVEQLVQQRLRALQRPPALQLMTQRRAVGSLF